MRPPRKLTIEELNDLREEIEYHKAELDRMTTHGGYFRKDLEYHRLALLAALDKRNMQESIFNNKI